jgi:uncharacterized protein (TIGR02594 family)
MTNSEKLYNQALKYLGVTEINGIASNKIISSWVAWAMPYVKNESDLDSRYAWCAIFISKMMDEIGLLENNKPIVAARKFLDIGTCIDIPKSGDLVILERGLYKGHITIFNKFLENGYFEGLGGNQANKVGLNRYSIKRVLGYRSLD